MRRLLLLGCCLLAFFINSVFSQSRVSSADIKGTVTDQSGAVLRGVTISIISPDKGTIRQVVSDDHGQFLAPLLPPDEYQIRLEMPGFATIIQKGLTLNVGQIAVLDFKMEVAGTATEVVVTSAVPIIETERTQQSNVVEERRIENLPINGRNFLDFSLLTPGVTSQNSLTNVGLPQLGNSGLSFSGQSGRNNNVTIDGADNNDASGASVRGTMSQEAIQEFQINRSNFSAEFGRASGGLINIVTKSGSNTLHGNLFFFLRDEAMDARNPFAFGPNFSPIEPQFSRMQYGATLGGPIVKDKTFFFGSFERLDRKESQFMPFNQNPNVFLPTSGQASLLAAVNSLPASADIPVPSALALALGNIYTLGPNSTAKKFLDQESGVKPFYSSFDTASVRLDHAFSARNQFSTRFIYGDSFDQAFVVANLRARTNGANNQSKDYGIVLSDTAIFSATLVNEARFQFARRHFDSLPVDPNGPNLSIAGIGEFGRNFNIDSLRKEDRFQWVDNFTLNFGRHRMKTGFDINHIKVASVTEMFFGGAFSFGSNIPMPLIYANVVTALNAQLPPPARISTDFNKLVTQLAINGKASVVPYATAPLTPLQAFNTGLPYAYQQGFGDPAVTISSDQLAFYFNDSIKITPSFTLDAGLRYDYEVQPSGIHRDGNNWGPRMGFSWDPWKNGKTVIRGGGGLYYSPMFEGIAFISKVLSQDTGIFQVFTPATGTPFLPPTTNSISIYQTLLAKGFILGPNAAVGPKPITASDLAPFGIVPTPNAPFSAVFATDPTIQNPYSTQASLGVDHQIQRDWAVSVNYIFNKGNKVLRLRDTNMMRTSIHPVLGIPQFSRINPLLLQVNQVESSGESIYHGGTFELNKRFSRYYTLSAAYTYAKAIDTATDIFLGFKPNNNDDVRAERALSLVDQRQRLVLNGVLQTPFESGTGNPWFTRLLADINISGIFQAGSGRPWNLELGYDANGDTQNTDRAFLVTSGKPAVYAGRNTGLGPDYINFDLRVVKRILFTEKARVELSFEAFNLFNRVNYSGVNNIVPSETLIYPDSTNPLGFKSVVQPKQLPTFRVSGGGGKVTEFSGYTAAFAPRQIQLAIKLVF
jgi:hypothetical protein